MAKYNPSNAHDVDNARKYFERLINGDKVFEMGVTNNISSPLNRYLHLIIGKLALEIGETAAYTKTQYFKIEANYDVFVFDRVNNVTGEIRQELKSIKDESVNLPQCISRFRNYALATMGVYLPDANEKESLKDMAVEIEKNKEYL